ncbi:MAG: tetratricopeptide repeat protein [Candidatus Margulisiibacteriota bacterium]
MVIKELRDAGLEDPFEITTEIIKHVENLFKRYDPKTQLEKAIILFRSVIPPDKFFEFEGVRYFGLTEAEGGLEIRLDYDYRTPLRMKFGDCLPKEIMAASKEERVAYCLEYSHLLVVLLRAAGMEAHAKGEVAHVYLITPLDGNKYRLDAEALIFEKTQNGTNTDRESIAMHYSNECLALFTQGKPEKAVRYCDIALEFKPDLTEAWSNKGYALDEQGKLIEAIGCYDNALEFKPDDVEVWINKGVALDKQGKPEEAIECYERALDFKPDFAPAWFHKGMLLLGQKKSEEANRYFDMALKYKADYAEAWYVKGMICIEQGKEKKAMEYFYRAQRLQEKNK